MLKTLETKDLDFKFTMGEEAEAEAGTFTGYASIFDMVDAYGETVMRGAFKKTLREKKQFPLLWSHNVDKPIGVISGIEDEKGLSVMGKLNLDVQLAREIRSLMAQAAIKGLSIGFNVVKESIDKESNVRQLKEISLWEVSPCVFQACPEAEVGEVKSLELKPYPNEHSARLKDPDDFDPDSFRRKSDGTIYGKIKVLATADVIWGKLKGASDPDDYPIPQAIRFPTSDWTEAEAKAWLKDNKVKYIEFESASEPEKSTPAVKPEALHLIDDTITRIKEYLNP